MKRLKEWASRIFKIFIYLSLGIIGSWTIIWTLTGILGIREEIGLSQLDFFWPFIGDFSLLILGISLLDLVRAERILNRNKHNLLQIQITALHKCVEHHNEMLNELKKVSNE